METDPHRLRQPKLSRSGGRRHVDCCALYKRLPPQGGGIALALMGVASLLDFLSSTLLQGHGAIPTIKAAVLSLGAVVAVIQLLRLSVNRNWQEVESLRLSSAHGALLVAVQLGLSKLPPYWPRAEAAAVAGILLAGVAQLLIWYHFVHHIIVYRVRPEPFWTPVSIFWGTFPLTYPGVSLPLWLRFGAWAVGVVTAIFTWPPTVRRVLRRRECAADPTIFMVMAPVPFLTLGGFSLNSSLLGWSRDVADVIWLLNVVSVCVTFFAVWKRRRRLLSLLWPMKPSWVALTFPLTSSCNAALHFWLLNAPRSGAGAVVDSLIKAWALSLLVMVATLVPLVNVAWLASVPCWLFVRPPSMPASICERVPPSGSGAAMQAKVARTLRLPLLRRNWERRSLLRPREVTLSDASVDSSDARPTNSDPSPVHATRSCEERHRLICLHTSIRSDGSADGSDPPATNSEASPVFLGESRGLNSEPERARRVARFGDELKVHARADANSATPLRLSHAHGETGRTRVY